MISGKMLSKNDCGAESMHIIPLDRQEYDYFELHYSYTTNEHYRVELDDSSECMCVKYVREKYPEPRREENTDTLYQEYWNNPEAYAVCDDETNEILGYVEVSGEEWNNRLRMTQLLVKPEHRGKGAGKFMLDFVKSIASEREYRIIVLEAQNYNIPAIDFYRSQGFAFCGGNVYFYTNEDIQDDEVMLEMAYLVG